LGGTATGSVGFAKSGTGTLELYDCGTLLTGSISIAQGVVDVRNSNTPFGAVGSGNFMQVTGNATIGDSNSGTLRFGTVPDAFNSPITYTDSKEIRIEGKGYNGLGAIATAQDKITTFGGSLVLTGDADVRVGDKTTLDAPTRLDLIGRVDLAKYTLYHRGPWILRLDGADLSDSEPESAIRLAASTTVEIDLFGSGGSFSGQIYGDSGDTTRLLKKGAGSLTAAHIRVGTLTVNDDSTVKILYSGGTLAGSTLGTSRVTTLALGGSLSTGQVDLTNNDLIIDYSGSSPIGAPNTGTQTVARWINAGWNNGGWNGTGNAITTTSGNAGTFALGYAEAATVLSFSGGTATFSGQTVDNTSVLVKFTYYGDATLDGLVSLDDFTVLSDNFGTTGKLWEHGDFNYDGSVNLTDHTILSANFGSSPQLRGSGGNSGALPPRAYLYIAMLDFPQIYWESRLDPTTWAMFEPFESMNLGPIPDMPAGFRASIPEPAAAAVAVLALGARGRRTRRAV